MAEAMEHDEPSVRPGMMPPQSDALLGQRKYRRVKDLNSGTYGRVQLAIDRTTNEQVAIKLIERGSNITKYVERELLNHSHLLHPHIVQFREVFLTRDYLGIAMEYAAGGDMFQHVTKRRGLSENESRWFFQQLILGLDYSHQMGVVNRDIKLENTLLDGSTRPLLKICDFGYSKHENDSLPKSKVGTPGYTAPEVISNQHYHGQHYNGQQADVWSAGVMLYVMLYCLYPFERPEDRNNDQRFQNILQRILRVDWSFPTAALPVVSSECKDLISRILVGDPNQRITVQQILQHPWFVDGLPDGVIEMNTKCLSLRHSAFGLQSDQQIMSVLNAAKTANSPSVVNAVETGTSLLSPSESDLLKYMPLQYMPPPLPEIRSPPLPEFRPSPLPELQPQPQPQPRFLGTTDISSDSSGQDSSRALGEAKRKGSPGEDQAAGGSSAMSMRNRLSFGRLGRKISYK